MRHQKSSPLISAQEKTPSYVKGEENPGQASGDRLQFPVVQAQETSRRRVRHGRIKASLSNFSTHTHNVVAEQRVDEPKEETPGDKRVSSEEESADLPVFAE